MVGLLLENGADIEQRILDDSTPLSLAAAKGHTAVLEALLEKGVEVNTSDALTRAIKGGHETVTHLLLGRGVRIDAMGWKNVEPLHHAAYVAHVGAVRLLLERGANIESRTLRGHTPLHYAVRWSHRKAIIVPQLLEAGADVRTRNNEGKDLLASCDDEEVKFLLLEYAARLGHKFDSEQQL